MFDMFELYSNRNLTKKDNGDVFVYDPLPREFRIQIILIIQEISRNCNTGNTNAMIKKMIERFARQKGLLLPINGIQYFTDYVLSCNTADLLDLIDFYFATFSKELRRDEIFLSNTRSVGFSRCISELNDRFKQHNLGYEFVNQEIIRKDSEHMHKQVIKQAIKLLNSNHFEGANDEFFKAYENYSSGDLKGAIIEAAKSFESTMKAICDDQGYMYNREKDSAKQLIIVLKSNAFFPEYLENHLNHLVSSLESGLPTLRNKIAGHGQGSDISQIDEYYVEYALNLAATNIIFLAKQNLSHRNS